MIKPLEIMPSFHPDDLIQIYVGDKAQEKFLRVMGQKEPFPPAYMPPIGVDIFDCDWSSSLGKNVIITGRLHRKTMNHFTDLLLECGSWAVVGLDLDNELHLTNADIFRCKGIERA